jgi:TolB-like protein
VGDSGEDQKLIRAIARKGRRFIGVVHSQSGVDEALQAARAEPKEISKQSRPALPLPDRPSIAVPPLPFSNMSGSPEDEYFREGITEDIITSVVQITLVLMISRNSSFVYKGKPVHIKQMGEELGVGYVIEGSVRRTGDRLRITVQLNDVTTGSHIWVERYDRALADVFAVQDEITETIVVSDDPMVLTALCAAHSVVGDLDIASVLIQKAVAAMAWDRSGWVNAYLDRPEVAIKHFQRALRLSPFDPTNFNCFFGIRNAHFAAGRYGESLAWCKKGMAERPELV